ncbi:MAG TPA: YqiA/YcfP family alpha/beta fold hydrolase [Vicinamibacterales bacterium]|nr:YqiA/YcfP family alpha/beta fold hydrolase [Vicinamibacterales bacterium]
MPPALYLYLHGFASSPSSSKATWLAQRLAERGIAMHVPDLNQPDFSTLTITRMLEQVDAWLDTRPDGPVVLIGSSLGGFVAVNTALRRRDRIAQLVLLAPALAFGHAPFSGAAPEADRLEQWKASGQLMVFHYAYGRMMPLRYALYEDALRYDVAGADLRIPALVFQGRFDTVVNPAGVEAWCAARPNVRLRLLDDDHQLAGSLETIWQGMEGFLTDGE